MTATPIVVDLDGTLIQTDLLFESANRYMRSTPIAALRMMGWTLEGKAALKARLADSVDLDVTALPYREDVLAWLREQRSAGRILVLATAADQRFADKVAAHLGLFDLVIGSDRTRNLGAGAKAAELVSRFGERGFEYIADHRADLAVWDRAEVAHVVGTPELQARIPVSIPVGHTFAPKPNPSRAVVKAMRPHQWAKNVLVLIPLFLAHQVSNLGAVQDALLAFIAFCLAASGVYVLNDLTDVDSDRHHHSKRRRPFASGEVSLLAGWALWPILLLASIVISILALPFGFTVSLVLYIALTCAYTFVLKRRAIIDVITLSLLYTLRLVAGALAIGVTPTFWLLAFSLFFFLSLALMKRYNDVVAARSKGDKGAISGRGYVHSDAEPVTSIGIAAGMVSALILALYINDPIVADSYATPMALWPLVPLLLYWVARVWLLVHRGAVHDDPIFFALRDRASWAVAAAGAATVFAATVIRL